MYKLLDNKDLNMSVRRYTPNDKEQIDSWWTKRNHPIIPSKLLPEIGYIVDNAAAGFLYKTDGNLAIIENFVTSPDADSYIRDNGLEKVTESLIQYAKDQGFERVMAITTVQSIYERALRHGFEDYGNFRILNKSLK